MEKKRNINFIKVIKCTFFLSSWILSSHLTLQTCLKSINYLEFLISRYYWKLVLIKSLTVFTKNTIGSKQILLHFQYIVTPGRDIGIEVSIISKFGIFCNSFSSRCLLHSDILKPFIFKYLQMKRKN